MMTYHTDGPEKGEVFITWEFNDSDPTSEYGWTKKHKPNVTGDALILWYRLSNMEDKILYQREFVATMEFFTNEFTEIDRAMRHDEQVHGLTDLEQNRSEWTRLTSDTTNKNHIIPKNK
jgi:hypothetical protein